MKVSAWVTVSDLIYIKKSKLEIINDTVFGEKTIYKTHKASKIFTSLKNAGVDGIELLIPLYSSDKNISDVKQITRENNIPVLSIHQSLSSLTSISLSEITRLCQIANLFSAKVITLHAGALGGKLLDPYFVTTLKELQKKYKVAFGVENMPKSLFFFGKGFTYRDKEFTFLLKDLNLSITFDTTHLAQVGGDIIDFYLNSKDQIVNIHLSDYKTDWVNKKLLLYKGTHLPLLKGELDIKKFLSILKKNYYSGLITMEINGTLEELCESARTIKSI
jgi:sugar phosphate isomerase/epimerase